MTGSIIFAPICSKCKHIITDEVNYKEDEKSFDYLSMNYNLYREYEIKPYKCSNCGTVFRSIVAPGDFPIKFKDILFVCDAVDI